MVFLILSIKNIKATLHNWEKTDLRIAKIHCKSLRGKIEFIGMVREKDDHIYQSYLNKYFVLMDRDKNMEQREDHSSDKITDDEFDDLIQ
jgi:hypothetical protein